MSTDSGREEHGLTGLLKGFADELKETVRRELQSARDELTYKAKNAGAGAGMLSGSLVGALFTLACLTALTIIALALVVPLWLSTLIVTVIWGVATAVLAMAGKKKIEKSTPFLPENAINNLKEEVPWAEPGRKSKAK